MQAKECLLLAVRLHLVFLDFDKTYELTLCMYRDAVSGKLIIQKSKSEMHKDNTNAVVA